MAGGQQNPRRGRRRGPAREQDDASDWAPKDGPADEPEPGADFAEVATGIAAAPAEESDEWSDPQAAEQSDKADRKQGRERAHRRPEPMRTGGKLADLEQRLERLEAAGGGEPEGVDELRQAQAADREQLEALREEIAQLRRAREADQELIAVLSERFRAPEAPGPANGEPLDLNRASFEELRALGISKTQATRVISAREAAGAYASLDELDGLPGFSPEQLEAFKSSVRI
jgi:DNA uptake protein ComE-like DNA-binding protein